MSNDIATATLLQEIDSRLAQPPPQHDVCGAHADLHGDVRLLLRCQRATLVKRAQGAASGAKWGGIIGGALVGLIEGIKALSGH